VSSIRTRLLNIGLGTDSDIVNNLAIYQQTPPDGKIRIARIGANGSFSEMGNFDTITGVTTFNSLSLPGSLESETLRVGSSLNKATITYDFGDSRTYSLPNVANSSFVMTEGAQTLSGVKTFNSTIVGNVSGNAGSATTLQTARSIGGVLFNGASDISLPGVNIAGNQNTTGNSATASRLQTARSIGGVSFNGASDISLPGVNLPGNQSTTGTSSNVTGVVSVSNGGTGSSTTSGARTNLGATLVGANLFTLAINNSEEPRFLQVNANNSVSMLDAVQFRAAISAGSGTGTGTVTRVQGLGTVNGISLSGVVTTDGSLTLGGTLSVSPENFSVQSPNRFLAGPTSGSSAIPTFRALVAADVPTLNQSTTGTSSNVTGIVQISNGGTGATNSSTALSNLGAAAVSHSHTITWGTGTTSGPTLSVQGGSAAAIPSASGTNSGVVTTAAQTFAGAKTFSSTVQTTSLGVGTAPSTTTGEIRATNNITAYFSDDRLKTKLGVIENALEKVSYLTGFYYIENETAKSLGYNNDKVQVGVSAQSVMSVLPESVVDAPINSNFEGADYKTVQYDKLVPLLIEATKELKLELDKLKKFNNSHI